MNIKCDVQIFFDILQCIITCLLCFHIIIYTICKIYLVYFHFSFLLNHVVGTGFWYSSNYYYYFIFLY